MLAAFVLVDRAGAKDMPVETAPAMFRQYGGEARSGLAQTPVHNLFGNGEEGQGTEDREGGAHPSESRRAQDAKRDFPVALSPSARRRPLRPGSPRSGVTASPRRRPAAARHDPYANGLTASRMRSACCLRGSGARAPAPLRQSASA
jgi:hypothetical protein